MLWYKNEAKGQLAQIKTGEGKTTIISMLAVMLHLQGQLCDIVTTSSDLVTQQLPVVKPFFKIFGISVGNINDKSIKKKASYVKDIIYGNVDEFIADSLRYQFSKS